MSEVNFSKPAAEEAPKPAPEVNETPNTGVPAKYSPMIGDYLPGFADLRLPRLNVVHGIGKMKDTFTVGSLVFNQQFEIWTPKVGKHEATPPVEMVILGWLPLRFAEKVKEGRGMLVNTPEEVRRAGGTLDFREWKAHEDTMKRFEHLIEAVVLARQPEAFKEDVANFPFVIDDSRYLLSLFPMKGMAYNNTAKGLFTLRSVGCLRERGYPSYSFNVGIEWKATQGDHGSFIPKFHPLRPSTESFLKYAVNLAAGPQPAQQGGAESDSEEAF